MFGPANVNFIPSTETSPPSQAASSDAEPGGFPSTQATSAPGHSADSKTLIFGSPGSACSTSHPITGTADTTVPVQKEDELTLLLRTTKPPPVMCEDIWFDDGNIVLHVDETIFRVHRSILAKHSSILRSMLSLPQPDNDEGKALRVVPLYDSVADVKEFLTVLYNPFYFSNARHSFNFLSGILRLSTKYDIPDLREEAICELKRTFPTTLCSVKFMFPVCRATAESLAIHAINLARETDCWEILPCAFYYCSRLPIPTIVRGTSEARLSRDDVDACIIGRDLLLKKQREVSHPFLYAPPPELPSPDSYPGGCSEPVTCVKGGDPGAVLEYVNGLDMLTPMTLEPFTDWQKIGRCAACSRKQAVLHWKAREKVWEELPQIFGLGTWESIRERGD